MNGQESSIKRVAILFAGGPAPAANAVISTAAMSFLRNGIEVVGIKHGYSSLEQFDPATPLEAGRDYIEIDGATLSRMRSTQGILIGTARANPGRDVSHIDHLDDVERTAPLRRVIDGLRSIGVDALVSIGGDDTLKTANKLKLFVERQPGAAPLPVVHLPKTIDNDYRGIDFTFGFFTAVDTLGDEIRNLLHDAAATRSYFIAETMGRSAGWLAYGAAMAGEASLVISVEDIDGDAADTETITTADGSTETRHIMNVDHVVGRIVNMMLIREKEGKEYGVIVLAEGLAELLPQSNLADVDRDDHGHVRVADVNLYRTFATLVAERYRAETGTARKVTGVQLGYESRCARPHAFDVMLGSQLGVGAFRALIEEELDGVMVSVEGQLDLCYVPFSELVEPTTLVTRVRTIEPSSDFHRLARFLETYVND